MLSPSDFHDLVSGRRRGVSAAALRLALLAAEAPYTLAVSLRNRRFDRDPSRTVRVGAPVVSVGNLTLGGSGKTPMVKWLARRFRAAGVRVAIVSRGYGAEPGAKNDEALELEGALPDVPHLQNPDRVAAASTAIEELSSQAILADDAFQHRRLGRDLDIVLLDATEPFGHGHVFPRGLLREPVAGLKRADVVCLTRADRVDDATRSALRGKAERLAPRAVWCEAVHRPQRLLDAAGETAPLETLRGKRVAAFCGIGNPAAFRATLEELGAEVASFAELPDHHAYAAEDIARFEREAEAAAAELVLCTHKDLVKVGLEEIAGRPLRAVVVDMELTAGATRLEELVDRLAEEALKSDQP
ncbi:Tetraacyldisaccharide 4'-kinase [Pseudobythopirellula maris]|uniref:Tetraacyldisaccharide 4'-kinase n=1 Tax=Pseudobythopirellula maris TaxID=2527991 RepID=A0A5C5ZGM1_9BACT|nr:tetraacyldisaccharide 4'-kinase [Pseudobythopirellula maris]TWT86255.1 Tetraacyldisaccharide 4'-kinase [Pseudobythopirellula maris]